MRLSIKVVLLLLSVIAVSSFEVLCYDGVNNHRSKKDNFRYVTYEAPGELDISSNPRLKAFLDSVAYRDGGDVINICIGSFEDLGRLHYDSTYQICDTTTLAITILSGVAQENGYRLSGYIPTKGETIAVQINEPNFPVKPGTPSKKYILPKGKAYWSTGGVAWYELYGDGSFKMIGMLD